MKLANFAAYSLGFFEERTTATDQVDSLETIKPVSAPLTVAVSGTAADDTLSVYSVGVGIVMAGLNATLGEFGTDVDPVTAVDLFGWDGNDEFYWGSVIGGSIEGGAGNDTLFFDFSQTYTGISLVLTSLSGSSAAVVNGNDVAIYDVALVGSIEGSAFDDLIDVSGADYNGGIAVVDGGDGNDIIYGSLYVLEDLFGGLGNDTIYAGGSSVSDYLFGDDGDDYLVGNSGQNVINGGDGFDYASYETANIGVNVDLSIAGLQTTNAGSDQLVSIEALVGSDFDDSLYGNAGANELFGRTGNDLLDGGDGNDLLISVAGNDTMLGGTGDDSFLFGSPDSGTMDGGAGVDTLQFDFRYSYLPITFIFSDELNADLAVAVNQWAIEIDNVEFVDNQFYGSLGDDLIDLTGASYEADGGILAVNGGEGNDVIIGSDGQWEDLQGGIGNDTLIAGNTDDYLYGGIGDDLLIGNNSTHVLDGGGGIDVASYAAATGAVTVDLNESDFQDTGGSGTHQLVDIENLAGSSYNDVFSGNPSNNLFYGEDGDDILNGRGGADIIYGGAGADHVIGGSGSDILWGNGDGDFLEGGNGADQLFGGVGWDELDGGNDNDLLDGGNGNDMASYASASGGVVVDLTVTGQQDTVSAGLDILVSIEYLGGSEYDDTLTGNDLDNQIYGEAGSDLMNGGFGNDLLIGGLGNDEIRGGAGFDILRGDAGFDNLHGDNGNDVLLGGNGNDWLVGGSGTDRIYGENDNDTIFGGDDGDFLFGQMGNDVLDGGEGDDIALGHNGDDTVSGGAGNDRVDGNAGNDILFGDAGNDILVGNWGVDQMTGGAGADTFLFKAGHTGRFETVADTILDFSQADGDLIDLSEIDANSGTAGDQSFTFIGDAAFSGTAGELRTYSDGTTTFVAGDVDGDGTADFFIKLDGDIALAGADFVL